MPVVIEREHLTEDLLSNAWERQSFEAKELRTPEGNSIQIVHPGQKNNDSGPDFRDAIIVLNNNELLRGDIELHVKASDWYSHGHHHDPNYNNVVLHVVIWDNSNTNNIALHNGNNVATVSLNSSLTTQDLHQSKQLPSPPHEPCHQTLDYFGMETIVAILDDAGRKRFQFKSQHFGRELLIKEPKQVLYESIMGALGYSKNKQAFQDLAQCLPLSLLEELAHDCHFNGEYTATLEALLLGSAGLLKSCHQPDKFATRLDYLWQSYNLSPAKQASDWMFFRVRPENHPTRRLAAAAHMLTHYRDKGLLAGILELVGDTLPEDGCTPVEEGIMITTNGYWTTHTDIGMESKCTPTLIGRDRAREMTVNVILPFCFAWGAYNSQPWLRNHSLELFQSCAPTARNWVTTCMGKRIFGKHRLGRMNSAQRQQGLIHLHRTYCSNWTCFQCPLFISQSAKIY